MKSMNRFFLSVGLVLLALTGLQGNLQAQVTPKNQTTLTLSASTVGSSTTATITSQAFTIKSGAGFAVVPNFVLASSGTSNVTFNFQVSLDGTNWTTTTPFTCAIAATGATPVIAFYNFPAPVAGTGADNIAWVRLASVQNANSSTLTLTSVTVTRDN